MLPGTPGVLLNTVIHLGAVVAPHVLVAETHTVFDPDDANGLGKLTAIELLVPGLGGLVMLAPGGTVQLYDDTPGTTGTVYTCPVDPGHTGFGPVITPTEGVDVDMVIHLGGLGIAPTHPNAAVTHNCPVVNTGKVTLPTLACPWNWKLAPPTENDHVYTVAPTVVLQLYGDVPEEHATEAPFIVEGLLALPCIQLHLLFELLAHPLVACTHML